MMSEIVNISDYRKGRSEPVPGHLLVIDTAGSTQVLSALGELDLAVAPDLDAMLQDMAARGEPIILDLSACRYLDSTILTVLIRATKRWNERFAIVIPPEHRCWRMLKIAGLEEMLPIEPSLAFAELRLRMHGFASRA